MSETNKQPETVEASNQLPDNSRRDALKKMGKYSAYTAPALLAMLTPKQGRAGDIMSPA